MKQPVFIAILFILICNSTGMAQEKDHLAQVPNVEHVIIYQEDGRFAGWPANCGAFIFKGDEILTGFIEGPYLLQDGHNLGEPYYNWLARSTDGGSTWTAFDPERYVGDFGDQPDLKKLKNPVNFLAPGFAMRIVGNAYHGAYDGRGHFFLTRDAGNTWQGPFGFGNLAQHPEIKKYGLDELTPRTDYIVTGKHACVLFISAREKNRFGSDRLFCIKTTDGGQSFEFVGWIIKPFSQTESNDGKRVQLYKTPEKNPHPTECRAVMSQSVQLSKDVIISVIRRKYIVRGGSDKHWLDAYMSKDGGQTWEFRSFIADCGGSNGNPPSLALTKDGRLWVAYGERNTGTIRLVYSSDQGLSWSNPRILMDGFWSEDMELNDLGYCRLLARSDGKLVALFYYSTKEHLHHLHAAIWDPEMIVASD